MGRGRPNRIRRRAGDLGDGAPTPVEAEASTARPPFRALQTNLDVECGPSSIGVTWEGFDGRSRRRRDGSAELLHDRAIQVEFASPAMRPSSSQTGHFFNRLLGDKYFCLFLKSGQSAEKIKYENIRNRRRWVSRKPSGRRDDRGGASSCRSRQLDRRRIGQCSVKSRISPIRLQ